MPLIVESGSSEPRTGTVYGSTKTSRVSPSAVSTVKRALESGSPGSVKETTVAPGSAAWTASSWVCHGWVSWALRVVDAHEVAVDERLDLEAEEVDEAGDGQDEQDGHDDG